MTDQGLVAGDRYEKGQLAVLDAPDADTLSNAGVGSMNDTPSSYTESEQGRDIEKTEGNVHSSASSTHEKKGNLTESVAPVPALEDENIVDWDGPDDPQNPMNWSTRKKWGNIAILSALTLLTPLASSMFAPGVPELMKEFHTTSTVLAEFVVSVYILGFAIGPLVVSPLSEMYGRWPLYQIANIFFIILTVGCALATNMNMLIAFRFLAGVAGIAPITIGGGSIADMVVQEKRGGAMAIWGLGPLLGPVIGPVAGGYLSGSLGWRWVFWVLAMVSGVCAVLNFLISSESYAPVLLERKASRLRKETGNESLRSKLHDGLTAKQRFMRAIIRPSKMLIMSPIVLAMSLYMSLCYGVLYLLFTTFTFVFTKNYGFSESNVGLTYIALGVGSLFGLLVLGVASDKILKYLTARNGGGMKPEYRLPPVICSGPFIPVGLFIYGWTAEHHVQWAVPLFGTLLVGFGIIGAFLSIQTYLVDAFPLYAASAIAANTVLRSLFGAFLPLAGLKMYGALGLGWGNSLLAFVTLALTAVPPLFYIFGERVRTYPKFQIKF
ncbi:hypothetical protein MBLNU459_g0227t1 [Dothideomycetes sp. NU459]